MVIKLYLDNSSLFLLKLNFPVLFFFLRGLTGMVCVQIGKLYKNPELRAFIILMTIITLLQHRKIMFPRHDITMITTTIIAKPHTPQHTSPQTTTTITTFHHQMQPQKLTGRHIPLEQFTSTRHYHFLQHSPSSPSSQSYSLSFTTINSHSPLQSIPHHHFHVHHPSPSPPLSPFTYHSTILPYHYPYY